MKIFYLLMFCSFLSFEATCQTKDIYAKRHEAFNFVAGFDHVQTNLGAAPERWVRHSELKKVTKINETVVVMETDLSCEETYSGQSSKWRPGKDTTVNHPVFTADISVDSMRRILSETYFFDNDMSEVKFVGFEETKEPKQNVDKKPMATVEPPKEEPVERHKKRHSLPMSTWVLIIVLLTSAAGATQLK